MDFFGSALFTALSTSFLSSLLPAPKVEGRKKVFIFRRGGISRAVALLLLLLLLAVLLRALPRLQLLMLLVRVWLDEMSLFNYFHSTVHNNETSKKLCLLELLRAWKVRAVHARIYFRSYAPRETFPYSTLEINGETHFLAFQTVSAGERLEFRTDAKEEEEDVSKKLFAGIRRRQRLTNTYQLGVHV